MSYALERFANGDTNYVGKLNTNADATETALNRFEAAFGGQSQALNIGKALTALFGSTPAVIGAGSYACTLNGTKKVDVAAGFAWQPNQGAVVQLASATTLDLTSAADGTYYISANVSGTPVFGTSSTDALYRVIKSAGNLQTPTRLAVISWGQTDWAAAQSSAKFGALTSLDARLEAGEALLSNAYDLPLFIAGKPAAAGAVLCRLLIPRALTFPAAYAGSLAGCRVAPSTNGMTLQVQKNGAAAGTIAFAVGATSGVFTLAAGIALAAGDVLTILADAANTDPAFADISVTLAASRT